VKIYCIIVAGGNGRRMLSEIPKQFLLLGKKPILLHTLEVFSSAIPDSEIILVLPEDCILTWKEIALQHNVNIPYTIVAGGKTRFQSVKKGLSSITLPGMVAVHDAVRPLLTKTGILRFFSEAAKFGNAVPVAHVTDSVRQVKGESSRAIDRNSLRLVQTPEIFYSDLLIKAFETPESPSYTDVTSVVESTGFDEVHLCDGEDENIKITRPFDLILAETILNHRGE
jgi:2-C-methyl-D-erythritol 4-phosphate cytidylyltransferase